MAIYKHTHECMEKWLKRDGHQAVNSVYGEFSFFNSIGWVLFE